MSRIRQHQTQDELLLFERSSPGKVGYQLPSMDVPGTDPLDALGANLVRDEIPGFPEVSEVEVIRHFTRLSTWNYAIDLGLYPLGSCTMKYNPRLNEAVARIEGIIDAHPYQPECLAQGLLRIQRTLEMYLADITGMDALTLQPAAGAHGELTGLLLIRAFLESRGNARRTVLIPDSAHGTNPATAAIAGYEVLEIASNRRGMIDLASLRAAVDDSVAALMVTNPNTVGIFEQDIAQVAGLLHAHGAQLYMDGANMNALVGVARPGDFGVDVMHLNLHKTFSTPHGGGGPGAGPVAVKSHLEPFLPIPRIRSTTGGLRFDWNRPSSIGRVRAFYGNFGVLVRALAYILAHGGDGLRNATMDAVLNANYIRKGLEGHFDLPYDAPSMHECIFSDARQAKRGVRTGEIAKRLIDYGFHPYTVSFPLIVRGALMIEPTETESKRELDEFVAAMQAIAREVQADGDLVRKSPVTTRTSRVDETRAARKPTVIWKGDGSE
jgi:glycine dehydrogenase subunit 2